MRVSVGKEYFPDQVGDQKMDLSAHFYRAFEKCAAEIQAVPQTQTEDQLIKNARAWGLIRRSGEISFDERSVLQVLMLHIQTGGQMPGEVAEVCYTKIFSVYERRDRQELFAFFQRRRPKAGEEGE